MTGVIGEDGVQWEHCNSCAGWVQCGHLHYERPTEQYPYGRDLCQRCADGTHTPADIERLLAEAKADRERVSNSPEMVALRERLARGSWVEVSPNVHKFVPAEVDA